jgi:hypothetical protein
MSNEPSMNAFGAELNNAANAPTVHGYSGLPDGGINIGVDVTSVVVGNGYHNQVGNVTVTGTQDVGYSHHYDTPVGPINIGVDVLNLVAGNGAYNTLGDLSVGADQSIGHHF